MKKLIYIMVAIGFYCNTQFTMLYAQNDNNTAFIEAINKGEIEKVKEQLENGVDPNLEFHGRTPLMFAIWSKNTEIFKLLVDKGAKIEKKVAKMDPLINMAASVGADRICIYLIEKGVDIDTKDREGKTPLMNAIYSKHPQTAQMIIDKGANVNAQETSGWTALMFAAMHNDITSVENLIKAKADVNLKTNDGETPLKRAKLLGRDKIVDILIAAGANE